MENLIESLLERPPLDLSVTIFGMVYCFIATFPAFYNICRYHRHFRTFAMSLFYLSGISGLLLRVAYFLS